MNIKNLFRVLYRAPQESLEATRVSRLFLLLFLRFSLILSSGRYGLNKLFHPLCAVSLHLLRDVSVNIQRKRGGSVSEVFLHGLDVITALDRGNGEGVTQIVEACGRCANVSNDTLEAVIHGSIRQIAAGLVGEYEAVLFPCITGLHPHTVLFQLLKSEQLNNRWSQRQTTALVILWWREIIPSAFSLTSVELLFDENCTLFKINTVPHQAEQFTLAQAGKEVNGERNFILAVFQEIQKLSGLLVGQRMNLFFDDFRQNKK